LQGKLLVVCGYGGWDDAFTNALVSTVSDDNVFPDILWTFHSGTPQVDQSLLARLLPGINRGRVTLYKGIDCNELFPDLFTQWQATYPTGPVPVPVQSNPVRLGVAEAIPVASGIPAPTSLFVLEGDDQDRPPYAEFCVGRDRELGDIVSTAARVVFITGFGGEGKSTLAARYFGSCNTSDGRFDFRVWRDCKEESGRFENQLTSVIESLTAGSVTHAHLADRDAKSLIEILVSLVADRPGLFVFDNVDHYVNWETERLLGPPGILVDSLLSSSSRSKVIFTCRPTVRYDHAETLSIRLEGLDMDSTLELFRGRGASCAADEVGEAHRLTNGHAFWLDLLALQVSRRNPAIDLTTLVTRIKSGVGLLPDKTLNSIWNTLNAREQLVLRTMAETVKPETAEQIAEYVVHEVHYHKAHKALKALRTLNLVVVKIRPETQDLLELHPLVKQFVRHRFPLKERLSFITWIRKVYQRLIGVNSTKLTERPALSILQMWTQDAELDIAAGLYDEAFGSLAIVCEAFAASRYSREFVRVARLLLDESDWVRNFEKFRLFETVFRRHVYILSELGENNEVDALLDRYSETTPDKGPRYIDYCDMRCHSSWARGDFESAITWGKIGRDVKVSSGMDTQADVAHNLSLAERDGGRPEAALPFFLAGRSIAEVTSPGELDTARDGSHYGNVGRCLHLMGQISGALVCYQKSALLIEKNPTSEHVLNQGFIRAWIAELLVAREQFELAAVFYRAAYLKWVDSSPPRAARILPQSRMIDRRIRGKQTVDSEVEVTCRRWINGQNLDQIAPRS